jgi:hypothetical protein
MELQELNDLENNSEFEDQEIPEEEECIDPVKQAKIEEEKKEVLKRVGAGITTEFRDKVAYILNYSNDARNSDLELAWSYWEIFESDKFNGSFITKEQLFNLTKIASISRTRAKIQNEYKLFLADPEVRKHRGKLEESYSQQAVDDKPTGIGSYIVYIDETGKTQSYLSVGSLWLLEAGSKQAFANLTLSSWKVDSGITHEFHFAELSKAKLPIYKEFFTKFLSLNPTAGFKLIVVNNTGFTDKIAAITDLSFHLINKGIEQEVDSSRAPLPRILQVWIDADDPGSDMLKIENLKERITSQKIEGLYLDDIYTISSNDNFYIQAADLFTAAVNRKLHNPESIGIKDELANFILDSVGFDINSIDKANNQIDNTQVIDLTKV